MPNNITFRGQAGPSVSFVGYMGLDSNGRPSNNSVAVNLTGPLGCTTEVSWGSRGAEDIITLNGSRLLTPEVNRFFKCIRSQFKLENSLNFQISSTFLSGSGFAGSAALFASATKAIGKVLDITIPNDQLSKIASSGSGSAARALIDGFVFWSKKSGKVEKIFQEFKWPEFRVLAIFCGGENKLIPSYKAHQNARTSKYFKTRVNRADDLSTQALDSIQSKDMIALGKICEEDSLAMHGCLLTSEEPVYYLSSTTWLVIEELRKWRSQTGSSAFFSLNYGSNLFVILHDKEVQLLSNYLKKILGVEIIGPFTIGHEIF